MDIWFKVIDAVSSVVSCQKDLESYILWVKTSFGNCEICCCKRINYIGWISLTVNEIQSDRFRVNIVPYTVEETLISKYRSGDPINIEIDVSARYVERLIMARGEQSSEKDTWAYWEKIGSIR